MSHSQCEFSEASLSVILLTFVRDPSVQGTGNPENSFHPTGREEASGEFDGQIVKHSTVVPWEESTQRQFQVVFWEDGGVNFEQHLRGIQMPGRH